MTMGLLRGSHAWRSRPGAALAVTSMLLGCAGPALAGTPRIPLCPGLQIVTAVQQPTGDYESIKTIEAVDDATLRIRYASESLVTDVFSDDFGKLHRSTVHRSVLGNDLQAATLYEQRFFEALPDVIPGSTAIGVSAAVLKALRSTGKAAFSFSNLYSGDVPVDRAIRPNVYDFQTPGTLIAGTPAAPKARVLVNGEIVELPVIRARGDFGGEEAELEVLDDEANPLILGFRIGIDAVPPATPEMKEMCQAMAETDPAIAAIQCGSLGGGDRETLQVVRIDFPCVATPAAASALETALAGGREAAVYDISFSFGSDEIREESEPRLREIAAMLGAHPDWRLAIHGHTDSVASEAFNLHLSQRRAAAVKTALVERHGVEASRLDTAGFGESQPRDSNDTLEGRARNRRVELSNQ